MKIIYVHQYFTSPSGSGGIRSYDLAKKFLENGHEVEFITTSSGLNQEFSSRRSTKTLYGMKFHVLRTTSKMNSLAYWRRSIIFFQFVVFSSIRLIRLKGDLVLATSTPLTVGIPVLLKKWLHRTPYIFEIRDVWPEAVIAIGAIKNRFLQKLLYFLEALIYKNASALVPLSTDMKLSITTRFPKLEIPIEVIPNISELSRFQNEYDPSVSLLNDMIGFQPRFTTLYAGTFGRVNGLKYVLELAKKTLPVDSTIVFLLIGSGSEKQNIIELAKEYGVYEKNVFIKKSIPKKKLPQIYNEVQMGSSFVLPIRELWANSANKFFDTLAAGKPVLINHGGWQAKCLKDSNSGYELPSDIKNLNTEVITDFVRFTKNKELYNKKCNNAFQLAHEFSLEKASEKYESLLPQNYTRKKKQNTAITPQ